MKKVFIILGAALFLIPGALIALDISSGCDFGFVSEAEAGCGCTGCNAGDVRGAVRRIDRATGQTRRHIRDGFVDHRNWIIGDFYTNFVRPGLQAMATQLSTVGLSEVFLLGTLFDAKQQLETQRQMQHLAYEAHRDYQPSESFCAIGTSVRSLAASERRADVNTLALNQRQMQRHMGQTGSAGAQSRAKDKNSRWQHFRETYCDPTDNNWLADQADETGLAYVCETDDSDLGRFNKDIDFKQTIWQPRTLNVSFTDGSKTADETDVMALGNMLFGHNVLSRELRDLSDKGAQELYMDLRSIAAKRNVAENSYNALVGLKSEGSADNKQFLKAILKNLGVADDQMADMLGGLGDRPSLYAQLEVLSQRLFQNPRFFSQLYDTPVNVRRKSAALRAIELMLDRAIYESQVRQEMTTSVLLSTELRPEFQRLNELVGAN